VLLKQDKSGTLRAIPAASAKPEDRALATKLFIPFTHPRVIVHDAKATLAALKCLLRGAGLRTSIGKHAFIFHILETLEGGISDVEAATFERLSKALGGGSCTIVNTPDAMTAPEVIALAKRP
jgi:hypothetical protein